MIGTHTHCPTADHQILNGGTGYISDAGMCGDYDSSLGMDKEEPLNRFLTRIPRGRFEAATGPATICGVAMEISDRTGLVEKIAWRSAGRISGRLLQKPLSAVKNAGIALGIPFFWWLCPPPVQTLRANERTFSDGQDAPHAQGDRRLAG